MWIIVLSKVLQPQLEKPLLAARTMSVFMMHSFFIYAVCYPKASALSQALCTVRDV